VTEENISWVARDWRQLYTRKWLPGSLPMFGWGGSDQSEYSIDQNNRSKALCGL